VRNTNTALEGDRYYAGRAEDAMLHHTLRVLVVDNEPQIGRFVVNALSRHHVDAFDCPTLALGRAEHVAFDYVFCDLIMPRMSGYDFYQQLTQFRPELASRFTLMTGAAISSALVKFLEARPVKLLCKPFGVLELTRCLPARP
jgi:CheY-like chemotaxis protein